MARAWMPLYIGDYLADTMHLNTLQHGIYLRLIMHYWEHGGLPTKQKELAAICDMDPRGFRHHARVVLRFFSSDMKHKRIEAELARANRIITQRHIAGSKGGTRSGINKAIRRGHQAIASTKHKANGSGNTAANAQVDPQANAYQSQRVEETTSETEAAREAPRFTRAELDEMLAKRRGGRFYAEPGTPQLTAWEQFSGHLQHDRAGGAWVTAEWPPGHEGSEAPHGNAQQNRSSDQ